MARFNHNPDSSFPAATRWTNCSRLSEVEQERSKFAAIECCFGAIRYDASLSKKKAEINYQNETIASLIESIDNIAPPGGADHAILNGNRIALAAIAGPRLEMKVRPGGSSVN